MHTVFKFSELARWKKFAVSVKCRKTFLQFDLRYKQKTLFNTVVGNYRVPARCRFCCRSVCVFRLNAFNLKHFYNVRRIFYTFLKTLFGTILVIQLRKLLKIITLTKLQRKIFQLANIYLCCHFIVNLV